MRLRASVRPGRSTALGAIAVGAAAAVALSGCAVAHAPGAAGKLAGSAGATLTPTKSPERPALPPKQRAAADAVAILASFAVPRGARKLSAAPTVSGGVLTSPAQVPGTPDLVNEAEWWIAPGAPQSVLRWEAQHLSHRFSTAGAGTESGRGVTTWFQVFAVPAVPAVLDSRQLTVEVVQDGAETAIRVDAQVTWQPARLAGEKVPAAAKAVTISMNLGLNQGGRKPPKPVTITDPARVRALVALINGLTPFPPGQFSCPADFGGGLTLRFLAGPGAPALAVAIADLSGCDGVSLTIGGRSQPDLAGPGTDSAPQILKAAGLPWKIPAN